MFGSYIDWRLPSVLLLSYASDPWLCVEIDFTAAASIPLTLIFSSQSTPIDALKGMVVTAKVYPFVRFGI
jgi:hypothetical protein